MKFDIKKNIGDCYYIVIYNGDEHISYDKDIAKTIGIPLKQYRQELSKFNIYIGLDGVIFYEKNDAIKALKYLINKYGVIIALIG